MQQIQHSTAAARFAQKWAGRGYEKGESQVFWIELLHDVLGVESPTDFISFENQVKLSNTSFIDAYIASTRVLIGKALKETGIFSEEEIVEVLNSMIPAKRAALREVNIKCVHAGVEN